jgi:NO-binding membrane sensor protein with MHYT domain
MYPDRHTALWAGTRVSRLRATVGAALIMGVAVSGMHYTGMAALQIHRAVMSPMAAMASSGGIASVSGTTGWSTYSSAATGARCRAGRPPAGMRRSPRTDSDRLGAAFTG